MTRDGGGTWQETTDPDVLRRNLPFLTENQNPECCFRSIAFAGPTHYALGDNGWLWRSHDLTTFDRVRIPGRVRDLSASDGAVIVRLAETEQLVRITADGQLQTITVR